MYVQEPSGELHFWPFLSLVGYLVPNFLFILRPLHKLEEETHRATLAAPTALTYTKLNMLQLFVCGG